jgi:hypothetical protein
MMICPCANCENTQPLSECLNGALAAEVYLARADHNMHRWILVSIIFCGLAIAVSFVTKGS